MYLWGLRYFHSDKGEGDDLILLIPLVLSVLRAELR